MLSDAQIKRVWDGMLAAEIRSNYFAEMVGRYTREQKLITWFTLFASSGAVATLLADLQPEYAIVRLLLMTATAALSILSLVKQNQKAAIDAADLHLRWNKLSKEYERLWENVYSDTAQMTLDRLSETASEISKAGASFPNDQRSMLKWQEHVERHRLQPQH